MPKKKKGKPIAKILLVVTLVAIVSLGIVAWHDGLIGITPIEDIFEGNIIDGFDMNDGTVVTVKGTITDVNTVLNWVTINDGTGSIGFEWGFADDLIENSVVVVRGTVETELAVIRYLDDISSVQVVWLFA
jgi:hypothetical protein